MHGRKEHYRKSNTLVRAPYKLGIWTIFQVLLLLVAIHSGAAQEKLLGFVEKPFALSLVQLRGEGGREISWSLELTTPFPKKFSIETLPERAQLVVDLEGVKLRRGQVFPIAINEYLQRLRLGIHDSKTRVVLDFQAGLVPRFAVKEEAKGIILNISVSAGSAAEAVPEAAPIPTRAIPALPEAAPSPSPTEVPAISQTGTPEATLLPGRAAQTPVGAPRLLNAGRLPSATAPAEPEQPVPEPTPQEIQIEASKLRIQELLKFSVDRVLIQFEQGTRPIQNVMVKSKSDRTLYMTASAQRVVRPGRPDQTYEPTDDLLVSPRRFELDPGGQRMLRLVLKVPTGASEGVFRVALVPQTDSFEKTLVDVTVNGRSGRLDVVAGLSLLALAPPENANRDVGWEQQGNIVSLINRGTASVFLESGRFCPPLSERCISLPMRRLYPGNRWNLKVPGRGDIEFLKRSGSDYESLVIPVEG